MELLDELGSLLNDANACSKSSPGGAPDASVVALERRFSALHERWIAAARSGADIPLAAIRGEYARIRVCYDAMPEAEATVRWEQLRAVNGWFKVRPGQEPPKTSGLRSAVGEAHDWVVRIREDLTYEVAYRERTHACDCGAAAAVNRRPTAELVRIGPWSDGYYMGDEMRCPVCNTRWFRGISDDDRGGWFYEVIAPSR